MPVDQQDRGIGPVGEPTRRNFVEAAAWAKLLEQRAAKQGRAAGSALVDEQRSEVGDGRDRHRAFVKALLQRHPRERSVAAVAGAHDAGAFGIDDAALDKRGEAIRYVALHLASPLGKASALECIVAIG